MVKVKKAVTKYIIIILIFSLLIIGCSKYSSNENSYTDASKLSGQSNTDSRNKEHEELKPTHIINVEKEITDKSSEEESKSSEEESKSSEEESKSIEEESKSAKEESKLSEGELKPTKENLQPTEGNLQLTEGNSKAIEVISKPFEIQEEINSSKQNDNSVIVDDSLKNTTKIKKNSKLCFDNCLYTFSKVIEKADSSQLVYKGEVTGCVDYLMTPIINGTANTFIKGASIYQWNDYLVVEWDEAYYLYEYESDVKIDIQEIDYSTEDINSACTAACNFINDIDGVILNDIWLDRDYGALYRAYYMKYGNGASNGISEENVMVFEANLIFDSDDNEYGERANTKIILIKDTVNDIWHVDEARLYW